MGSPAYNDKREELYQICGDAPDPAGTGLRGVGHDIALNKTRLGKALIRWRDRVIEADVYEMGGQLAVHMICPKCSRPEEVHALWVKEERKAIEYDARTEIISIEKFRCQWHDSFGTGWCNWTVAIDKNIAKDA